MDVVIGMCMSCLQVSTSQLGTGKLKMIKSVSSWGINEIHCKDVACPVWDRHHTFN